MDAKYQCNICFEELRDACLTECCGQHYCSQCLYKWTNSNAHISCPQCREADFKHIKNKSLMREIHSRSFHLSSSQTEAVVYDAAQRFCCVKCKVEPLREPCLTDCCGQHVCKSCLTEWLLAAEQTCPHCKQKNITYILDKSLKREIDETFVRCIYSNAGCMWMGYPKHLRVHLQPTHGGCEYANVLCSFQFCIKIVAREDLERHQRVCRYRRENCKRCGLEVSHNAMSLHCDECPETLIPSCPNKCNSGEMKLKDLPMHFQNCPHELVDCPYQEAGCGYRVARKYMENHVAANETQHMTLLHEQNRKLQVRLKELSESNRELRRWNRELVKHLLHVQ